MIRVAIRGFVGRQKLFEDLVEVEEKDLDELLPRLAEKHGTQMAAHELHHIEIEFLDEPDPLQRFFRFGTNAAGMVMPLIQNPVSSTLLMTR
jgi:hypothetical protein